mgnify:CR=1 FL=1
MQYHRFGESDIPATNVTLEQFEAHLEYLQTGGYTVLPVPDIIAALLLIAAIIGALILVTMYIVDVRQTEHTIRRNYPVIGRFRYLFEHVGEFFRQYFFAQDREELPFNRAQRSWVYRAAKNVDSTIAFGSTRPLNHPGDVIFLNCLFPTLPTDATAPAVVTVGGGYARQPYSTGELFHISAMSFGALSAPAIQALSTGAAKAGIAGFTRCLAIEGKKYGIRCFILAYLDAPIMKQEKKFLILKLNLRMNWA